MRFLTRTLLLCGLFLAAHAVIVASGARPQKVPAASQKSPGGGRVECSALASKLLGRSVRFCAVLPPSYDAEPARRFPVLYWLHGLGQDEQSFIGSGGLALLEEMRAQGRLGEFLLITPDAGRSFYLNSRDGHNRYEDFFITEFVRPWNAASASSPGAPPGEFPASPWADSARCISA